MLTQFDEKRKYYELADEDKISQLKKNFLEKVKTLYVKGLPKLIHGSLDPSNEGKIHLTFNATLPELSSDKLTVYTTTNRYIEWLLKALDFDGQKGRFDLVGAKIAADTRKFKRVNVQKEEVWVDNFRLGQFPIHSEMKKAPLCVEKQIDLLRSKIASEFSGIEIIVYDQTEKRRDLQAVHKLKKPLYIEDTLMGSQNKPPDPEFLDYKGYLKDMFSHEMDMLKHKKVRSLIVIPIIYANFKSEHVMIGYFRLISNKGPISMTTYTRLNNYVKTLIKAIQKSNIKRVKARQRVINVSKFGVQIGVNDSKLIELLKSNPGEVVMDIKPSIHVRYTLLGKVSQILQVDEQDHLIGLHFIGGASRLGLSDWVRYTHNFYHI
ncbi:MAG: hypothetical protein IEMM0008_0218 [bacterium]|nr:MAG: hypothetical protein IEMM0008_0218 [bacterium]